MIDTWLPETCWATSRREIKNTKVTSSWFFSSTLNTMHGQPHIIFTMVSIIILYYNITILWDHRQYMRSIVDRNVVMLRIPVYVFRMDLRTKRDFCPVHQLVGYFTKGMGCLMCGTEWISCEQIRICTCTDFIYVFGWPVSYGSCGLRSRSQWQRGLRRKSARRSLAGIAGSNPTKGMAGLSLFNVVCRQVQFSATGRSLVQRNPTECVSLSATKC